MPLRAHVLVLAGLRPIATGAEAPALSLTAEEGTWIKLRDYRRHLNVALVFFDSLLDDATDAFLKGLQRDRERFEALDTVIFGVSQYRTDRLREYRSRHGLEFHLVYDPLGLTARQFGFSHRVRPLCRPGVVVVDKVGNVRWSGRGYPAVDDLLQTLAGLEDRAVPERSEVRTWTGVRDPGAPKADAHAITGAEARMRLQDADPAWVLVDLRTPAEQATFPLPGALHVPSDELPSRYQELGQTTHILCVSASGGLAADAAEFLTSVGCSQVFSVSDGLEAWRIS